MIKLPEMTVEKRNSQTAHGLRRPSLPGSDIFEQQLRHVLEFVEAAKMTAGYPTELLDMYSDIRPLTLSYSSALESFGFSSWKQCVVFVKDDECNEFFVRVAKWAKSEGIEFQKHAELEGFIDGGGLGIHNHYLKITKEILEKGFDAKYYYHKMLKTKRPLEHYLDRLGFVCPALFNYVHPGHPRYPAGHSCKFFAALVAAESIWKLSRRQRTVIMVAAYVLSMARSGGGVHLPEDNLAGGYLAGVPEFQFMGK